MTDWGQKNINGFGDPGKFIGSLDSFGGQLYAGTLNYNGGTAQLWRSNGGQSWSPVMTDGFGDATNTGIDHLIEFNGMLYAGPAFPTQPVLITPPAARSGAAPPEIRVIGPRSWMLDLEVRPMARSSVWPSSIIRSMPAHIVIQATTAVRFWRSPTGDADDSTRVVENGLGDLTNIAAITFEVFNGVLYAGSGSWDTATNLPTGCEIWRCASGNAGDWTRVVSAGLGGQGCRDVFALAAFGGRPLRRDQNKRYHFRRQSAWAGLALHGRLQL